MSQISEIVDTTLRNLDGKWRFRAGARDAAIEAASKVRGPKAVIAAICGALKAYRIEQINPNWDGSIA